MTDLGWQFVRLLLATIALQGGTIAIAAYAIKRMGPEEEIKSGR